MTNYTSVAVHPSYNSLTNERDIAVMRIDLTQFLGPPLPFTVSPIGGYSKGMPLLSGSLSYALHFEGADFRYLEAKPTNQKQFRRSEAMPMLPAC